MVELEIVLRVTKQKQAEFLQSARSSSADAVGPHAVGTRFYQCIGDPGSIVWVERWPTREALQEHIGSKRFRVLMGAAKTLGHIEDARFVDDSQTAIREALVFGNDWLEARAQVEETQKGETGDEEI